MIGDVHGCATELRALLALLPLGRDTRIVFVGDYVDRGPRSRDVIETILELSASHHVVPLLGNHEAMLLDFLDQPDTPAGGIFIVNGGSATLASYGDDRGSYAIPPLHRQFLQGLALTHEDDDFFFVHAGVPDVPLARLCAKRHRMTMLWVREPFLRSRYPWDKIVVHGHTPVPAAEVHARRINVDSGCVFNGLLSAMCLRTGEVYAVQRERTLEPVFLRDRASNRVAVRFQGTVPLVIERGAERLHFETVDYNDFGALVCDPTERLASLSVGERIDGRIGPEGAPQATFRGLVLRRQPGERGTCYALRFVAPPRVVEFSTPPAP